MATIMNSNAAEDENSEPDVVSQQIPWYHVQLYQMYGKEADYFLYPKQFSEKQAGAHNDSGSTVVGSKNTECVGASVLWTKLRKDSSIKLQNVNKGKSSQLKVQDFKTLSDSSVHERLLDRRRATQVMWRASRKNEDNASILLNDSPLPVLNRSTGNANIVHLVPSYCQMSVIGVDSTDAKRSDQSSIMEDCTPQLSSLNSRITTAIKVVPNAENIDRNENAKSRLKLTYLTERNLTEVPKSSSWTHHVESKHQIESSWKEKPQLVRNKSTSNVHIGYRTTLEWQTGKQDRPVWQPLTMSALLDYTTHFDKQLPFNHHRCLWPVNKQDAVC